MIMKKILKIIFLCVSLPVFSLSAENLTQYVNPMIGTDGYGNVYPGAQIPLEEYRLVQTQMQNFMMQQLDTSIIIPLF